MMKMMIIMSEDNHDDVNHDKDDDGSSTHGTALQCSSLIQTISPSWIDREVFFNSCTFGNIHCYN